MNNGYKRHQTHSVLIGDVIIGGKAPIVIQAMTNTLTQEVDKTVAQIIALSQAGAELVRLAINTEAAAKSVYSIRQQLNQRQCHVPLIGDFHYNGHHLLTKYPDCAKALDKYRINPALTEKALLQSVLQSAKRAEELGLKSNQIVLSCKVSHVPALIRLYQRLAESCAYPLHLGVTESGPDIQGVVSSSVGIGTLLHQGIGDTIRTSVTPGDLLQDRTAEVKVSQAILQSLELRHFKPTLITCPGCGRTNRDAFEKLVADVKRALDQKNVMWKNNPRWCALKIAVMGCVVNGPGESEQADIGLYLNAGASSATVYIDHKKVQVLKGDHIADQLMSLLESIMHASKA
jgi:(E)-4-hydroxy-3-methylbut-2-enyl-diphosphate synthase